MKRQLQAFNKQQKYLLINNKHIKKIKQKHGVEASRLQSPGSSDFTTPRKLDFPTGRDSAEAADRELVSESPLEEQGVSNNKRNNMQLLSHVRLGQTKLPTNILELQEANKVLSPPENLQDEFLAEYRKSNVSTIGQSAVRFDYSGIFSVKEEYIFVFSGYSSLGLLKSVEVFDTQREIWHVFGH